MEHEYPIERDWTATIRRIDTGTNHRINVRGVDIIDAAGQAKMKADQRFCTVVGVEVLE